MAHTVYPAIKAIAPSANQLCSYDQQHFLTYARLLDAEKQGVEWEEGSRTILLRDPEADPEDAYRCWTSHLARAHWIVREGLAQIVAGANAEYGNKVESADR